MNASTETHRSEAPARAPRKMRSNKLVKPSLQLRMTLWFAGISTIGLVTQFMLTADAISRLAVDMPQNGAPAFDELSLTAIRVLLHSLVIALPITLALGILVTARIAGPLHRMQAFLGAVAEGERPPDLVLRRGDDLQELAELVNRATAGARGVATAEDAPDPEAGLARRAG
jgi:methyl-accepting chemotaxis protein